MGFLGERRGDDCRERFWTAVLAFALTLFWPPATPSSEFGLARLPYAFFAAIVMGLVGLALFSARLRDWAAAGRPGGRGGGAGPVHVAGLPREPRGLTQSPAMGAEPVIRLCPRPSGVSAMETTTRSPADLGTMLLRFLAGVGAMLLAGIVGAFVIGFAIALVGFGLTDDKEVGLLTGFYGMIAGGVLGLAGLAWFSLRRRDGMPLWGGLTVVALVAALAPYAARGRGELDQYGGVWPILLVGFVAAFLLGAGVALAFRQRTAKR